jgi:hypothetical protein
MAQELDDSHRSNEEETMTKAFALSGALAVVLAASTGDRDRRIGLARSKSILAGGSSSQGSRSARDRPP